jgi:type VI secretion system protein ImpA
MLDLEKLLEPISVDEKCGQYLKYEHIYDQIREHRREDDPRLTQGIWQTEPKKANWAEVKRLCEDVLITRSKDLQIAVWLLEALGETGGFHGLHQGLLLLHTLGERFWDNVHPQLDRKNGDAAARMAPIYFLAEKFPERILHFPLTSPANGMYGIFRLSDWIAVRHNIHTKNTKGLTLNDLAKSVADTPLEFFQQLGADCTNTLESLKKFGDLLDQLQKNESPSFNTFYTRLQDIQRINAKNLQDKATILQVETARRKKIQEERAAKAGEEMDTLDITATAHEAAAPREATVDQAYEALGDIAAFLERKQPQSPASMLLKIASFIGKKTFRELMEVNMQNGATVIGTISELYKILKMPENSAEIPFQPPTPPQM